MDAIHLGDLSQLTMEYAGRFTVEMAYGADYGLSLRILEGAVSQLETNQKGTLRLDPDSTYQVLFTEE